MANPAWRSHTWSSVIATVLLAICGVAIGVWLASAYDVLRVGVLDNALALRLGYIGEITDSTVDPSPHGMTRPVRTIIFLVALIGGPISYAAAVVARRFVDDPQAIAYALGAAFLGVAAGFAWLSTGWPTVRAEPTGAFATFIGAGHIWAPLLFTAIAVLCVLVWWVDPETDEEEDGNAMSGADPSLPDSPIS